MKQGGTIDKTRAYAIVDTKLAYSQKSKARTQHLANCVPPGSRICTANYVVDSASDIHVFPVVVGEEFSINTVGVERADDPLRLSIKFKPSTPGLYYYGSVVFTPEYGPRSLESYRYPPEPTMESRDERQDRIRQGLKRTYPDLLNAFNGKVFYLENEAK